MERQVIGVWAAAGAAVVGAGLLAAGCGDDACGPAANPPPGCDVLLLGQEKLSCDQAAVQDVLDAAEPGQSLCFEGIFALESELTLPAVDGVTVRGHEGPATWSFDGRATFESEQAGLRAGNVTGLTIEDLTLTDPGPYGVWVERSEDVVIRRVRVEWSGEPHPDDPGPHGIYGILPLLSTNVLMDEVFVRGSSDVGIFINQVTNGVLRNSEATANVAGIEIENSTRVEAYGNEMHGNTAGWLVLDLPDVSPVHEVDNGSTVLVRDNVVRDNNARNFGDPSSVAGLLPQGTGLLVLAANDVELRGNTITGNQTIGLFVLSQLFVTSLSGEAITNAAYDPYPDDVHVHDNAFSDNGATPQGIAVVLTNADGTIESILWDGAVPDGSTPSLCIQNNGAITFRTLDPGTSGFGDGGTDLTPFDCSLPAIQSVDLGSLGS